MLILGGAATLNALTGMPTNAATFLVHYFNTFFIFSALFIFMFVGYLSDYIGSGTDYYGSPDLVLESLQDASQYAVMKHV